jgi:hypothetical protein
MVSFDVESLFTNVPTDLAFTNDTTHFHNLERKQLEKLLITCTKESHFQFNGIFYDQVDGVAMGSPLGPLFANAFMANFEKMHMSKLRELGVNIWLRYVDDIFATMDNKHQAEKILEYLNNQHSNLRFTIEHENENKLPFLDTCVNRRDDRYTTTIYRKKTFTGVYLNWTSMTSRKYKIGLIRCLADRIWKICTEEEIRETELSKLKLILIGNDYPEDIIDRTIMKYRESKTKPIETPPPEKPVKHFLKLPYAGRKSDDFAFRLKNLVTKNFPLVEFNVAFQTPMNIGKFFPFKDNVKNAIDRSLVVYKVNCKANGCLEDYIGKTKRILSIRLDEHKADKSKSHAREHERVSNHHIDYDKVEILDSADSDRKLKIKELLHIIKRKPTLNVQCSEQGKFDIKTILINPYPQFRQTRK